MRVLVGIAEMGVGGAEAVVEELATDRLARGDQVTVVSAGGFRAERLYAHGVRTVTAPLRGRGTGALVRSVRAVRREVRSRRPSLVHVHNVKAATVLRAGVLPRRIPALTTLHGIPDAEYASAARILRRCTDRLVAVSADVCDRVVAAGFSRDDVTIIENAITPPTPHDRDEARTRLGLGSGVPVALCLARLVDQKRHDRLIDAWQRVPADAVLLVAGDGPNRDAIAAAVGRRGLGNRVRLLGARTDVDWLLAAADVTVLASDWEGLPISILESMAAGVPVVAPAVGGLSTTLSGAAELVEPGSAEALGAALAAVLSDEQRRATLRADAAELVERRFGVDRMRAAYDAEYALLLG